MAIRCAISLLYAIEADDNLRNAMYLSSNKEELTAFLKLKGYVFDNYEFEEAVNSLHVQCQTLENAQKLMQKAEWLRYLLFVTEFKYAIVKG